MGVHPKCGAGVLVSETPRDRADVGPSADHLRGRKVPQRMEMRIHADPGRHRLHVVRHGVGIDRMGSVVGEDPVGLRKLPPEV
jgi:hypothetical protein